MENASFDASKPLEMDFGELSFNAFVKDINEIGLRLVAEKVREIEIRKLESNFVWGLVFYFIFLYGKGWVEFGYIIFGLNGFQWIFS